MDQIREIINKLPTNKITRIKYEVDMKKAGSTWMDIYKKHAGTVEMNPDGKKAWNDIIRWSLGYESDIDLIKGIGLIGRTGSGKTMTMYVLNDFIMIDDIKYKKNDVLVHLRFKFESALFIAGEYSRYGYDAMHKYTKFANLCIDDLGSENINKKHFGDTANVIQELIELRYASGLMTHFTSNLPLDKIKELYGDRVYSRLMDSVNIIKMNDCDYRIK